MQSLTCFPRDWHLVISACQIHGGKSLGSRQCIQRLFDAGKWEGILSGLLIELAVINTQPEIAISLLYQDNG